MRRLRERSRRKRVVKDFQVVPQFFKKEREKAQFPMKRKNKDERYFYLISSSELIILSGFSVRTG